jgi:hypothetical protein
MAIDNYNFLETCLNSSFPNICYYGFFNLLLGVVFAIFNCYGFIKMTRFFHKIKFENMLLLLSLIQLILFLIAMVLVYSIFFYLFIFIQIGIILLINKKFVNLSKGFLDIKLPWLNSMIIIINIIYLVSLIVLYALSLDNYISRYYYIIELISSIMLTIYGCKFLNLIKKKFINDKKLQTNNKTSSENTEIKNLDNFISTSGNELFYIIKKKQLTILCLSNIIFTIIEFSIEISLIFIESSEINHILIYVYFSISLLHSIIIFFSFYWIIREQYNKSVNLSDIDSDNDDNNLIDENYIEEEIINIENQNQLKDEGEKKRKLTHKSLVEDDLDTNK